MTEMKEKSDRPLVTFALFAYNQEKYIREAVEGAFAQTYEPLEIILSDDCSTDSTFEIMKEMAQEYRGPHTIIVNRNLENLCTLAHVFNVVDISSGSLILLAAGDDVSHPTRTAHMLDLWIGTDFLAAQSGYELIDSEGKVLQSYYSPASHSLFASKILNKDDAYDIHGGSSAYNLDFLKSLPRPKGKFFFEDVYMTIMTYLHGGDVGYFDGPLVKYRAHPESTSNNQHIKKSYKNEVASQKSAYLYSKNKLNLFSEILKIIKINFADSLYYEKAIEAVGERFEMLKKYGSWYDYTIAKRIKLVCVSRDKIFLRWALPRVLGLNFFVVLKLFYMKIRS